MSIAEAHGEVRESVESLMEAVESSGRGNDLLVAILNETANQIKKRLPRGGALSDEQVAFLIESGAFTPEEFARTEERVARGDLAEQEQRTRLSAVLNSLSAAEVAEKLRLDASRVRHRQAKGSLYAFLAGGKRRYPTWQFTNDPSQPVLPGLPAIVKAFQDRHPASIQGFMTTPQASLLVDGKPMTPPEWLMLGGEPQAVVDILDSFLQS